MGKQNIQAKNRTRLWTADEGTTLSLRNRRFQKGMSASEKLAALVSRTTTEEDI